MIGGVETPNQIWLAPLAGVTTRPYRDFHRRMGAGLVHTEMISAIGLSYENRHTILMLGDGEEKGPVALQLFGPDADRMANAAERALRFRSFCAIEINMACPMPKVTKRCGGASIMRNPGEAARMVSVLKTFGLPVWAKVRKTDERVHPMTTGNFCAELVERGADLLIVHGRTPAQRYEGAADKDAVISVARKFPGAVAASGDFFEPADAEYYLSSGCAAVFAARGAIRDAFLIPKTLDYLGSSVYEKFLNPSIAKQIEILTEACRAAESIEGGRSALIMGRRLLSGMLKGVPGAASLRRMCAPCADFESFERILTDFRPGGI
ncbi:MAG: tRNA-dihydrouridine synthase [Synergistaceae bacterium]|nr:tRNA-dihydrouridine synthase [Synergistaceae bacterium]